MKIILACDLDNTLLYSYKNKQPTDVCVELNKGKEQGFMSLKTCSLIKELSEKIEFVPVTTRSIEQYNRINWESSIIPDYAITTNGAIMLHNSKIDNNWLKVSKQYTDEYYSEMKTLEKYLYKQNKFIRCRLVDEMYVFAYCKDNVNIDKCVKEYSSITTLDVLTSGRKIYFFPKRINKGNAVKRLKEQLKADIVICAGDSIIDIPMLETADYAFVPSNNLFKQVDNKNIIVCNNVFSEELLQYILEKII